jgi:triosephosphate isomerase
VANGLKLNEGTKQMRVPLIAGNWKMNLTISQGVSLVEEIAEKTRDVKGVDLLVAPPFTALNSIHKILKGTNIILGAQNIFYEKYC